MTVFLVGLQSGVLYALLTVAIVIVFKTTGFVHFAIALISMVTVYLSISFHAAGIPLLLNLVLACLGAALLSLAIEATIARPIQKKLPKDGAHVLLLATLLVFTTGESAAKVLWGPAPRPLPSGLDIRGTLDVVGTRVSLSAIWSVIVVAGAFGSVYWLLSRTRAGLVVRAIADNAQPLGLVGISVGRYRVITGAFIGVVAGIAGLLLAQTVTPSPAMALTPFVKAMAGAALGGMTSLPGAALAAIAIGLMEAYATVMIGSQVSVLLPLVIIAVVLIFRPQGLLGEVDAVRV